MRIWDKTNEIKIGAQFEEKIGFHVWYEDEVDLATKEAIDKFLNWVYNNYNVKTPVFVNCVNQDYVTYENDEAEQGYIFNWYTSELDSGVIKDSECPDILLPVKIGKWDLEDILGSLVEAITLYFAWCLNVLDDEFVVEDEEVQEIVDKYYALFEE